MEHTSRAITPRQVDRSLTRPAMDRRLSWPDADHQTHLVNAGDPQLEEERHKKRPGHESGYQVTESPHDELTASGIDLGRMTQHQHSADDRHEHGDRDRNHLHLTVGDRVLADRSLTAAGESVVDANAKRDGKKHAEQ